MPAWSSLLLFVGASLVLLAIPGPAVVFVVTRSIDHGRSAGLVSVLGIELGTLTYALAAAAGLSGVLAASATAFTAVKYAGAAYLFYLGVRKLLDADQQESAPSGRSRLFVNGLVVQLLNPKIAIFFVAFLPQFVSRNHGDASTQMLLLGAIFTVLGLLNDGAYALAAGSIGRRLRRNRDAGRRLMRLTGVVYIGLGVVAALTGAANSRSAKG